MVRAAGSSFCTKCGNDSLPCRSEPWRYQSCAQQTMNPAPTGLGLLGPAAQVRGGPGVASGGGACVPWSGGHACSSVCKKAHCRVTHPTHTGHASVPSLLDASPCQVGTRSTWGQWALTAGTVSAPFSVAVAPPAALPL